MIFKMIGMRLFLIGFCGLFFAGCHPSSVKDERLFTDPNQCDSSACVMHKDKMDVSRYICRDCGRLLIDKQTLDSIWLNTIQNIQDSIVSYHHRILENNQKIIQNHVFTKVEKWNLVNDSKQNLQKAKLSNDNLYEFIHGKPKSVLKTNHRELDKLYAIVTYRLTILSAELKKDSFDQRIVIEYAMAIDETMKQITFEQQRLMVR